jgi:hypothetical protein
MSSPVRWDHNQPARNTTPTELGSFLSDGSRAPQGTFNATRATALQPEDDSDVESEDLLARALAVLRREQARWQETRSEKGSPGSRS